jgi:hypothetical protein
MLALEDLLKQFADGTILQRQTRLLQLQGSTVTVDGLIGEVSASELRLIPNQWRLEEGREHVVNISHSGSVLSQELLSFARHNRAHLTLSLTSAHFYQYSDPWAIYEFNLVAIRKLPPLPPTPPPTAQVSGQAGGGCVLFLLSLVVPAAVCELAHILQP